jgi:hypothetical protein
MSLTVASAALDTAWAEFGAVALTAGTLATVSACIDHVGVKLNRGAITATTTPSDAQINEWLIRAKQELADTKQFTFKRRYVTTTLTAGSYRYAMPPDYSGGDVSLRDMTNDRKIGITSNHQFDVIYPDPSSVAKSGGSTIATIKNNELWLMPPPSTDVVELDYMRSGDDITAADISWLPESARFLCCDFAVGESFLALDQFDKAQFYLGRWERELKKLGVADGKKRWATSGYRARSVLQA